MNNTPVTIDEIRHEVRLLCRSPQLQASWYSKDQIQKAFGIGWDHETAFIEAATEEIARDRQPILRIAAAFLRLRRTCETVPSIAERHAKAFIIASMTASPTRIPFASRSRPECLERAVYAHGTSVGGGAPRCAAMELICLALCPACGPNEMRASSSGRFLLELR